MNAIYKVLFIDDEYRILNSLKRALYHEGYDITTTDDPEVAFKQVVENNFAVVISDQRMPKMNGTTLLKEMKRITPDTIRIMLTGYADIESTVRAINDGNVYQFISKPWKDDSLKLILSRAVSQFKLIEENKHLNNLTRKQNLKLKSLNEELKTFNTQLEIKVSERTTKVTDLNKKLQTSFLSSIQLMDKLAQVHNGAIGSHARRITKLAIPIAKKLGIAGRELFEFQVASLLHDIGKIGISSDLLQKELGKLNPGEKSKLRNHVTLGESLSKEIPNLGSVPEIIRHHHEYFNGTGYPDQLLGDEIPMGSRIIAVVDAFDKGLELGNSFTSQNHEIALEYIKENSEILFDPEVIKVLVDHLMVEDDREIEVGLSELRPGMQLARNVKNCKGRIIGAKGSILKSSYIEIIDNWIKHDPVVQSIYIYRTPAKETLKRGEQTVRWE